MACKAGTGDDGLLDLVREIYATNLDEAELPGVLGKICRSFGAHVGMLADMEPDRPAYPTLLRWGVTEEVRRLFLERYGGPHTNPWIRAALVHRPGTVITTEMLPGKPELARTDFWTELIEPAEIQQFLGAVVVRSAAIISHVSLYRSGRLAPFPEASRARFERLVPHLGVAAELRVRLRAVAAERTAALETLHRLRCGVLLLDGRGRERFTNRAAQAMLDARDGLQLFRRELRCTLAAENRALCAAVAGAAQTGVGRDGSPGAAQLVSRPSGKRPYQLLVAPLHGAQLSSEATDCAVLVLVADPDEVPESRPLLLKQLYGLTNAEALLADALCGGEGLRELAQRLDIGYNTARTHLAHVLSKTGARRQSDLVRLLLALPS